LSADSSPEIAPDKAPGGMMRFRRKDNGPRLAPDSLRRQGEIARLAFQLLGREEAIAFLNSDNPGLGGQPLQLATASAEGTAQVETELARLAAGLKTKPGG
jgi:hypothetical protein